MGRTKTLYEGMLLGLTGRAGSRGPFASHTVALHDMLAAYDTFSNAAETKALKGIIERERRALPSGGSRYPD